MYDDKREKVNLSQECWNCFERLRDVSYANGYTFFWVENMALVQQGIRQIAKDIKGDLLRFKHDGKTVTFSLSDEAIQQYKPRIREFSSFGSAVKMLGAYENYVRKIVELSTQTIPQQVQQFKTNHKGVIKNDKSFIHHSVGRGIDFFTEVFKYKPDPSYKPALQFFFQLRNVAVHNLSIADKQLCDAANSKYVQIKGELKEGAVVEWNLNMVLQLNHLLTSMLPEADPCISSALKLKTIEKKAYWYLDANGG